MAYQLSGGMNQRAVIAIALANKPRILIADEPTTALDASVQTKIMQLLKTLCKTHRMSMLFITHNLALASDYADRIAVMQDGRIVENNDSAPFFDAPKHAYSQQLIAANKPTPSHGVNTVDHSQPILQCKHLNKGYNQTQSLFKRLCTFQVNDISFTLHRGETVALVGESGSGKTTIARIFMQLETPESGSLAIGRQQLPYGTQRSLQITQNNVQMIFQNPDTAMNPKWQIADILAEGIQTRKPFYDDEQITQLIDTLLDQVGLYKAIKNRYPHELSGGQKQRICIARALSMQPKVIICDEPTSALDVSSQQAIIELLQRLQQHHQYAYLLITHDLSVVSSLAHRVVVMQNGQIVESGSVQGVLTQPNTLYTQKLLNALPAMQEMLLAHAIPSIQPALMNPHNAAVSYELLGIHGAIGVIVLNRPHALNRSMAPWFNILRRSYVHGKPPITYKLFVFAVLNQAVDFVPVVIYVHYSNYRIAKSFLFYVPNINSYQNCNSVQSLLLAFYMVIPWVPGLA